MPLNATGSVEENAGLVAEAVRRHSRPGRRLLLAGASSGGPAIHLALSGLLSREESARVAGWMNLGGLLRGSPLIDLAHRWPQRILLALVAWKNNWDLEAILSMSVQRSRERFAELGPLPEIVIVWLLIGAIRGRFGAEYLTPVDLGGLYWHVVDLIWIFLFPLFYLI